MSGRRHLTDAERREVARRYLTGEKLRTIANSFGVSNATISRCARASFACEGKRHWSRAMKVEIEDVPAPKPTLVSSIYTPSLTEVARLKAKGLKNTAIAALLRLPYRVIEGVPAATTA